MSDKVRTRAARSPGDEGATLVELAVAVAVMTIVFGMTIPIVNTLFRTTTYVQSTNTNTNQFLPLTTNLQRLIRSAVSPAPTLNQVPISPFGQYAGSSGGYLLVPYSLTATSLAFSTNIGDPNGPAQVIACFVSSPTVTPSSPSQCLTTVTAAPTSFVVSLATAKSGTCPFSNTSANTCSYNSPRPLVRINNVINGNNGVFQYSILSSVTTVVLGSTSNTTTTWTDPVASANVASTFASCKSNPSMTVGTTTTSNPLGNCAAAEIQKVAVNLQVDVDGGSTNKSDGQAQDNSTIFLLSPISSTYSQAVG